MNINATLFGQVIVVFALLMAALGYYLGTVSYTHLTLPTSDLV